MESLGGSPHPQGRQRPQAGATAFTSLITGLTAEGARLVSCPAWQRSRAPVPCQLQKTWPGHGASLQVRPIPGAAEPAMATADF